MVCGPAGDPEYQFAVPYGVLDPPPYNSQTYRFYETFRSCFSRICDPLGRPGARKKDTSRSDGDQVNDFLELVGPCFRSWATFFLNFFDLFSSSHLYHCFTLFFHCVFRFWIDFWRFWDGLGRVLGRFFR